MTDAGYESLFNGKDLTGWTAIPRIYGPGYPGGPDLMEAMAEIRDELRDIDASRFFHPDYVRTAPDNPAVWTVENGAIVGRQSAPGSGYGGFLITERDFGDFELVLEAKPDWPADTGVILRKTPNRWEGVQVLLDHRKSGTIGQFFGNGIGLWHAASFALDAELDAEGNLVRLIEEDPATTVEPLGNKAELLDYKVTADEFLAAWKTNDWNELRIRIVGTKPKVTTWINGTKIGAIDLATLEAPNYDADAVAQFLGPKGRIALEVHDSAPMLSFAHSWGPNAACRWRNVRIKDL